MRGDVFSKWNDRVEVAHAGLTERASIELLRLQERITEALGATDGPFEPTQVIADPRPLIEAASRCAALLKTRDRVRKRFRRYRRLGPVLLAAVTLYVLALIGGTLYYTDRMTNSWLKSSAIGVGAFAVLVAIILFVSYAYYENRLSVAEELAQEDA